MKLNSMNIVQRKPIRLIAIAIFLWIYSCNGGMGKDGESSPSENGNEGSGATEVLQGDPSSYSESRNQCNTAGGTWRSFPNTCVDHCSILRNPNLNCGQAFTNGCDCGAERCWEEGTCKPNPTGTKSKTTPKS
ncbi:MAG: hypothetical protein JJT78_12910 [Leptospira sp.]|nr:hypothetical protein [Leptospira sp.]